MANKTCSLIFVLLSSLALAQSNPTSRQGISLEDLQRIALENNPTLKQAEADIRINEARKRQAGLWPNPMVGYTGEDIRGGALRGGKHGFFVEQQILLGGRLSAAKSVIGHEAAQSRLESDEQRMRVLNGVRLMYYRALAAQQTLSVRRDLAKLAQESVAISRQLLNVGQADETDVLQSEIEWQRSELSVNAAQNGVERTWRELVATVGNPSLPLSNLTGTLDQALPDIQTETWTTSFLQESVAVKIAQAEIERRRAEVDQAHKAAIPDLRFRAGLQQNREFAGLATHPIGLQGFAEVGITLPIFNRNQGGIAAAQAEVQRAEQESKRVNLVLQQRAAIQIQEYRNARAAVDRYRDEILPRAEKAHSLMVKRYDEMAASYPQVLNARRMMYQSQAEYIEALQRLWSSAITLQGALLTDGLEAPARGGEMDHVVRDIHLPQNLPSGGVK